MDLRQSKNYARYMESLGWIAENGFFIKKLWFTSIIKAQHFSTIDLNKVKKYHPFLIKLEPLKEINFPSFRKDNWPLIPSKTIILDLDSLSLASLPKDVRYEIRKAEKNGVQIRRVLVEDSPFQNVELFYKILQETMKIGHWEIPIKREVVNLYKSFQPNNSAILICHSGEPKATPESDSGQARMTTCVAGCLLVWHGDTAHYMYAANTKKGRELGAAYFTLWEAIKFCQSKKLKYLDLEGIYDERYPDSTKNWKGFTAFKLQWGGKVIEYPGSYTKYQWPK